MGAVVFVEAVNLYRLSGR